MVQETTESRLDRIEQKIDKLADAMISLARARVEKAQVIQNYAKWDAATKWCNKRNMRFRVLTEGDIYSNTRKPKPVKRKKK